MSKILKSRAFSWTALILIMAVIIITFRFRVYWWSFIDVFFAFMMVFCHLMSLYIGKMSKSAAGKLETVSFVCGLLMIVAFIVEYILLHN